MAQKFKPVAFAKQEDVIELTNAVNNSMDLFAEAITDLQRHLKMLELAVIAVAEDSESMSEVLVQAGLLESDEEDDMPEIAVDPDNPANEVDLSDPGDYEGADVDPAHLTATDEGMPEPESPEAKEARLAEIRLRRVQHVDEQRLREVEAANEFGDDMADPLGGANSVSDVPEAGLVVQPGRDPFTGEERQ